MDAAAAREDRAGVHQGDGAVGEEAAEDAGGDLVARVVEGAQDDAAVAQVVVDVGVVDPLAVLLEDRGRGDLDDLQRAALRVGLGAQEGDVRLAQLVVGVGRVGLGVRDDDSGRAKAATMSTWPRVPYMP